MLIFIGVFIAVAVEIMGIPGLPVAIGLYLPLELSATIMLGGIVRLVTDYLNKKQSDRTEGDAGAGILFCSGLIAGEGLVGIILAVFAVSGLDERIDLSGRINTGMVGGIVLLVVMIISVAISSLKKKADK